MERSHYLDRVSLHALAHADGEKMRLLNAYLPSDEQRKDHMECFEGFGLDPQSGHAGVVEYCTLPEALKRFQNPAFDVDNWHYDRVSEVVLINLPRGVHEALSAVLLGLYRPESFCGRTADDAENFLHKGLGWFVSSSSFGKLMKSKQVRFNAQEKRVFSGWAAWEI